MSGENVETIGTGPPGLLEAMLGLVRRHGIRAATVTGYRERSYNIGYCETCSELVSEVRIFYTADDGSERHYQHASTGLAELIRKLTDDPERVEGWSAAATYEPEVEHGDRYEVHGFDEEPAP